MDNLNIYNKYKQVPGNALKAFNNGKFRGTDINTMWRIKCLTEEFGVCGIGWYFDIEKQWTETGTNEVVMCFVEIKLYIKVNGEWSKGISASGGSKLIQYFKDKSYTENNDEGYKMATTDALGVACKYLGFGADVYWDNDKTKYTDEPKEEVPKQAPKQTKATNGYSAREFILTFGKNKGKKLCEVDKNYLSWLSENSTSKEVKDYATIVLNEDVDEHQYSSKEIQQSILSESDEDLPF